MSQSGAPWGVVSNKLMCGVSDLNVKPEAPEPTPADIGSVATSRSTAEAAGGPSDGSKWPSGDMFAPGDHWLSLAWAIGDASHPAIVDFGLDCVFTPSTATFSPFSKICSIGRRGG
eukprot:COSAG01_NODE_2063_length_8512_cov_7.924284_7_plen_116_part_00